MSKTTMRWRVEHRSIDGSINSIIEVPNRATLEKKLSKLVLDDWVLLDGDTIHIIRQTED